MAEPFRSVALGRTNLTITPFGLGSAAFGWMYTPVDQTQAHAALQRAYELGCRYFDSAPNYGSGRAETRLGAVLPQFDRDSFVVSTKVGFALSANDAPPAEGQRPTGLQRDYSYDGTLRTFEGSLKRLNLDRIDLLFIHDPEKHIDAMLQGSYRALRRLRDEGVIGGLGIGINYADTLAEILRRTECDCCLLAGRYTLLDQIGLQEALPLAEQQGVAIVIGGPFNSGLLADPYAANPTFNYGPASAEWVQRAQQIDVICQRYDVPLKAAAIQFPLGHPAVAAVVSGARSAAEVEENVAMFRIPIPAALWDDLRSAGLLSDRVPTPAN